MTGQNLISHFRNGQSLIEVIVSLAVVIVLAISLVTTNLITQKASRSAKNNTQATKLVQENIEQLRILRDRKGFIVLGDGACMIMSTPNANDPLTWGVTSTGCPQTITLNNTVFSRSISISSTNPGFEKSMTVTVTWVDSSGTQKVENTTFLSNCVGIVTC